MNEFQSETQKRLNELHMALEDVQKDIDRGKVNRETGFEGVHSDGTRLFPTLVQRKADLLYELNQLEEELGRNEECDKDPVENTETPKSEFSSSMHENIINYWSRIAQEQRQARMYDTVVYQTWDNNYVGDVNDDFRGSRFDPDAGLEPKQSWMVRRLANIDNAIRLRLEDHLPIPHWWNKERVELIEQIQRG